MNNYVEEMKKFRAPWWSLLLGRYRANRRRKEALKEKHYIATITLKMFDQDGEEESWFHLYESGTGKRSVIFQLGSGEGFDYKRTHLYNQYIIPWIEHSLSNDFMKKVEIASAKN